jgi:copper chaperone CopZ
MGDIEAHGHHELMIGRMGCGSCAARIEEALRRTPER